MWVIQFVGRFLFTDKTVGKIMKIIIIYEDNNIKKSKVIITNK